MKTARMMFSGKPDRMFPFLKTGNVYTVTYREYGLSKYVHGIGVQVLQPIACPYSNIGSFYKNWKPII